MIRVTLVGMVKDNDGYRQAKPQDTANVLFFTGANPRGDISQYFCAEHKNGIWVLKTLKGTYPLKKDGEEYKCVVNNIHITLKPKKIVAHLSWE